METWESVTEVVTDHLDETVQEECVTRREREFGSDLQKEHLGKWDRKEKEAEKEGLTLLPGADKERKPAVDFLKSQQVTKPAALGSQPRALSWLNRDGD